MILRRLQSDIASLEAAVSREPFVAGVGCVLQWAFGFLEAKSIPRRHGLCTLKVEVGVSDVQPRGAHPELEEALEKFRRALRDACRRFSFETADGDWIEPTVRTTEGSVLHYDFLPADAQCRWMEPGAAVVQPKVSPARPEWMPDREAEEVLELAATAAPVGSPDAPSFPLTLIESPRVLAMVVENPDATARMRVWTDDSVAVGRVLTMRAGVETREVLLSEEGEEFSLELRFDAVADEAPFCELAPRRVVVVLRDFATAEDVAESWAGHTESLAAASGPDLPRTLPDGRIAIPSPGDSDLRVELRDYAGEAWLFSLSYDDGPVLLTGGTLSYTVGAESGSFPLLADGGDKAKGAVRLAQPFAEAARAEIRIEFTPAAG